MKTSAICLIAALIFAGPAVSQDSPQFTLKTTAEVVLVNVTVRDKDGNFVRNLTADDFTLLEDGKAQKILSLDVENTDAIVDSNPQVANLLGGLAEASAGQARTVTPVAVARNAFRDRRLLVLFFDLSSMEPDDTTHAIESAVDYVDNQMAPADLVAVVTLSNRLSVAQDFTADRDKLKSVLESFNPVSANGFGQGATGTTGDDTATEDASFIADDTEFNVFNTDRRLEALQSVAETLTGIEQKKSLIYFSSGMSRTGVENQSQLRVATNAAVRANLSIYTVDVRGLQAVVPGGAASSASRRGAFGGGGMRQTFDSNYASQETLVALANDTGGRAFLDDNDFAPAYKKVQEDTSMYYVLGYTSTNSLKNGRYRRITVTVKRKDVKLESRRGYYAETDFQHTTKENREQQLQEELASDLSSTDLPVYLSAAYFRLENTRYFVPVSLVVPGAAIPFTRGSDQDRATLDVLGMVLGEEKRPYGSIRDTVKLAVDAAQEVKRKNVQYDTGFFLPPGKYRLKFVVRENQSGQVGSFETDVFVPNLRQAPVKISSVIPSSQKQPARQKKDNPLIRNGSELIPSVTHVFSSNQRLFLYYELYDVQTPVRLLTNARFFKGTTKVFETPTVEVTQVTTPDRRATGVELDVPLKDLPPGFYTCQVTVIDAAAGKFVFPRLALLVR